MAKNKYKKISRFIKWVIAIFIAVAVLIILYLLLDYLGLVQSYVNAVRSRKHMYTAINFIAIFFVVMIYGGLSLYNLLSHRAAEDSRWHCLPIILTPFFLIVENGFVHAFNFSNSQSTSDPYYEIIMGIFTTTALGIITFASLKYSFEISTKQKRFIETSEVKPDIKISKKGKNNYIAEILNNDCYLCGVYIGAISKIQFSDIKRTGTDFKMFNVFFPNKKIFYKKGKKHTIDLKQISSGIPDIEELKKFYEVYFIFRDTINYYYLAQVPTKEVDYNVIGVNERLMERLIYKFDVMKEKGKKFFKYRAMDWFHIPYNFYPNFQL